MMRISLPILMRGMMLTWFSKRWMPVQAVTLETVFSFLWGYVDVRSVWEGDILYNMLMCHCSIMQSRLSVKTACYDVVSCAWEILPWIWTTMTKVMHVVGKVAGSGRSFSWWKPAIMRNFLFKPWFKYPNSVALYHSAEDPHSQKECSPYAEIQVWGTMYLI